MISNDDIAFVGAADGLYARIRRAGRIFGWSQPTSLERGPEDRRPVGGIDNFVHAVDAETGTKWEFGAPRAERPRTIRTSTRLAALSS